MTDNEINEAVARKLGYRIDDMDDLRIIKKYSTSIEAAWEVLEAMRKYELEYLLIRQKPEGYSVCFTGLNDENDWCGEEEIEEKTAPLAICRAFLKLSSVGDKKYNNSHGKRRAKKGS